MQIGAPTKAIGQPLTLLLTLCMVLTSYSSSYSSWITDPFGDSQIGNMGSEIPEDTVTPLIGAGMGQYTDMFDRHKSKHNEKKRIGHLGYPILFFSWRPL